MTDEERLEKLHQMQASVATMTALSPERVRRVLATLIEEATDVRMKLNQPIDGGSF